MSTDGKIKERDEIEATANYLLRRVQLSGKLMNELQKLVEGPEPEDWRTALTHVVTSTLDDAQPCTGCGYPRGSEGHGKHAALVSHAKDVTDLNHMMALWRVTESLKEE